MAQPHDSAQTPPTTPTETSSTAKPRKNQHRSNPVGHFFAAFFSYLGAIVLVLAVAVGTLWLFAAPRDLWGATAWLGLQNTPELDLWARLQITAGTVAATLATLAIVTASRRNRVTLHQTRHQHQELTDILHTQQQHINQGEHQHAALAGQIQHHSEQQKVLQKHLAVTQASATTTKYTEAVQLLAHDDAAVRAGGIYSLEQLLRQSPELTPTIIDVLALFVRENAPYDPQSDSASPVHSNPKVRHDVHAAVSVIGRQAPDSPHYTAADLNGVDLQGINLANSHFADANFSAANLANSHLVDANFTGAYLYGTNLSVAFLYGATLAGAHLEGADLTAVIYDKVTTWPQAFVPPVSADSTPLSDRVIDLDPTPAVPTTTESD